jgi:hypothetical protein
LTKENADKAQDTLLEALESREHEYLLDNYQPKEKQFLYCWTTTYRNLGAYSTQYNKGFYIIMKVLLNKYLQLYKTVEYLVQDLEPLLSVYYTLVNKQQNTRPRLLDLDTFCKVADLLIYYTLDLVITE